MMFLLFAGRFACHHPVIRREGSYALVCLDRSGACRGSDRRRRRRGRCRAEPAKPTWPALAAKDNAPSVDVELILAVDVSYSMDMDELAIQREGYAQAIVSKEFLQALKALPNGKIAVTYFEWAASSDQKIIIPWRVIDGPETADAVSDEIMKTPIRRASRTSISGAIYFAMPLFEQNPYHGLRRVIDISGDGPNNNGAPVTGARDKALSKGITINGLPIMVKEPSYSTMDIDNLDWYYEDCVIGGPGSFVVSIKDREKFKEAIRTKLLLEVAGRTPERPIVPVADEGAAGVLPDRREDLAGQVGAIGHASPRARPACEKRRVPSQASVMRCVRCAV